MTKEKIFQGLVLLIGFLFAASAIGYVFFPSAMLSIVGIESTPQTDFLVRTLAVALVSFIPSASALGVSRSFFSLPRAIASGLAIYLFLSSAVDLHAYFVHLVGSAALPSAIVRIVIGVLILWLMPRKKGTT